MLTEREILFLAQLKQMSYELLIPTLDVDGYKERIKTETEIFHVNIRDNNELKRQSCFLKNDKSLEISALHSIGILQIFDDNGVIWKQGIARHSILSTLGNKVLEYIEVSEKNFLPNKNTLPK